MPITHPLSDTSARTRLTIIPREPLLPVVAVLAAVCFWGGSFVAMRVAVQALSPWAVMWIRMVIALMILVPFTPRLFPIGYRQGDWKPLVLMVAFQPCLYFLLESYALKYTTASQAGVISASVPLLVALGAWFCLRERLNRFTVAGLVMAMLGVVALTLSGRPDASAASPLWGNTLELTAMACAAANMLMVKQLCRRYNPWTLTFLQVLAGTLFFAPGLVMIFRSEAGLWTPELVLSLFFLGAFVSLGAFGLYNWGMSRMPASRASVFINLVPVLAVMLGWVILNEGLNRVQIAAAVVVAGGVILSQRENRQAATDAVRPYPPPVSGGLARPEKCPPQSRPCPPHETTAVSPLRRQGP